MLFSCRLSKTPTAPQNSKTHFVSLHKKPRAGKPVRGCINTRPAGCRTGAFYEYHSYTQRAPTQEIVQVPFVVFP